MQYNISIFLVKKNRLSHVLNLYNELHEEFIVHLNGEDSFVLFDEKEEVYYAVRDIVGLRPLYYTFKDGRFYFSNKIKTFFTKFAITKEPDLSTMYNIVHHSTIAYDATMYKNIKRVPPGHFMKVTKSGAYEIKRYWKPEEIRIDYQIGEQEAIDRFQELFDKAIFDRIDDFSTTGFELSGGLDSSSIVSWVRYMKPQQKLTVFSMNFTSMQACDESEYIDAMQKKYSLDIYRLDTDKMDYTSKYSLENNYKLNPYWPIFITYTMGFSILERAKELKIKTILTGQGGDHVMAGNLYVLHEYFKAFKWRQLYREIKALPHPKSIIKRYLIAPLLGEKNIGKLKSLFSKIKGKKIKKVSSPGFQEFSDFYKGNSLSFKYDLIQVQHSTLSALMDSSYYTVAQEHFDIEFRHPFFDRRVVEFMLSLPPKFKYSEGVAKYLLRKAMNGVLPEKIRSRTDKAEFTEVLRQQIDAIDLDILFQDAKLVKLGLIEHKKLDKYKEEYISGKMKHVVYFWQLINLEYWYRFNFQDEYNMSKR